LPWPEDDAALPALATLPPDPDLADLLAEGPDLPDVPLAEGSEERV
jgi:hypothetical protein